MIESINNKILKGYHKLLNSLLVFILEIMILLYAIICRITVLYII